MLNEKGHILKSKGVLYSCTSDGPGRLKLHTDPHTVVILPTPLDKFKRDLCITRDLVATTAQFRIESGEPVFEFWRGTCDFSRGDEFKVHLDNTLLSLD
jgi:hypothetical protein